MVQALDALDEMIRIFDYVSSTHRDINPAAVIDLQKYYPKAWTIYLHYQDQFIRKKIEDNLKKGQREGIYRSEFNVEIITSLYTNCLDLLLDHDKFPLLKFGIIPLYKEFIEYHLHGILSQAGLEMYKIRHNA
jgi:hypothetical protein